MLVRSYMWWGQVDVDHDDDDNNTTDELLEAPITWVLAIWKLTQSPSETHSEKRVSEILHAIKKTSGKETEVRIWTFLAAGTFEHHPTLTSDQRKESTKVRVDGGSVLFFLSHVS